MVFPNAIAVTTFRKEYVFRSFWDRDDCYALLKDNIDRVKGVDPNTSSEFVTTEGDNIVTRPKSNSIESISADVNGAASPGLDKSKSVSEAEYISRRKSSVSGTIVEILPKGDDGEFNSGTLSLLSF